MTLGRLLEKRGKRRARHSVHDHIRDQIRSGALSRRMAGREKRGSDEHGNRKNRSIKRKNGGLLKERVQLNIKNLRGGLRMTVRDFFEVIDEDASISLTMMDGEDEDTISMSNKRSIEDNKLFKALLDAKVAKIRSTARQTTTFDIVIE